MGYTRYVGRVGALAVALGVGAAVASSPGVAWATETESTAPAGETESTAPAGETAETGGATPETTPQAGAASETTGADAGSPPAEQQDAEEDDPEVDSPTRHTEEVAPGVVVSHSGIDLSGTDDEPDEDGTDPSTTPQPPAEDPAPEVPLKAGNNDAPQPQQTHTPPQTVVGNGSPARDAVPAARSVVPVDAAKQPANATVQTPATVGSETVVVEAISDTAKAPEVSDEPEVVESVLTALLAPFGATGDPDAPLESPASWVLVAAARRQIGQARDAQLAATPPVDAVTTGQSGAPAIAAAAANLPPVIDPPDTDSVDLVTGAVTNRVNAHDPEEKKLTYTLVSSPAEGKLVLNRTTGIFTYTPTAAQRVRAQVPGGEPPVQFDVIVSDGVKANNQLAIVTVEIHPTQIADIGEVAAGEGALGLAVTNTRAYVTNADAGTVTVIDTIHRSVVATIDVDDVPIGVAVTPDGKKVYVSSFDTNTVSVIDAATNTVTSMIELGDRSPELMAISPDGKTLYVTTTVYDPEFPDGNFVLSSGITKISTATNRITGTVKNVGLVPYGITVSRDGKKVYVIAEVESDGEYTTGVFVFSSGSTTAKQIFGVGPRPEAVTVSPDGKTAYIGDFATGLISVVETTRYTVIDTLVADPETIDELVVSPDGSLLMVLNFVTHAVDVYDATDSYQFLTSVPTNATTEINFPEAALSPDGQQLYYTSDGALQVISLVPANLFPVPTAPEPIPNDPDPATGIVTGTVGVDDPDGDKLTYTPTTPAEGTVVVNPDGSFTYTPTAAARHAAAAVDADTLDTFLVTVSDGRRGVVTATITVKIAPANIAPTVRASVGNPNRSTGIVKGSIIASDKDKDPLTFTGPATPTAQGGTVTVDAKGRFVYTPATDAPDPAATTDTFTITVTDGHGGTVIVPVTVKIRPTSNAPTIVAGFDLFAKAPLSTTCIKGVDVNRCDRGPS
jgi:YVTN family beta-propeller protein/VCBS repeat-containing protein